MARQRKPKVKGTGADFMQSGQQMTVEPTPLWDSKHEVIGYLPMIKCVNSYGNLTMVAPALVELKDYYTGDIDSETMKGWGLDTPEGAMEAWEHCGMVTELPLVTTADNYIAGAILEGGYMRSLALAGSDVVSYREVDAGESVEDDAWILEEYDLEELADAGLPEGETWMEA